MFAQLIAKLIVHSSSVMSCLVRCPEVQARFERAGKALAWRPHADIKCAECKKYIPHDAVFCPYCDAVQSEEQSGITHVRKTQETEPINMKWLDNVETVRELPALPKGALLEAWRREKAGKR